MDRNDLIASPTHKELDIQHQIYNGVPVLELMINGQSIMRRISDGYMNATHILSQAGLSKGQRTKALEQFIQIHHQFDKVQGGYGRYQGTWIPSNSAIVLATIYNVLDQVSDLILADESSISPLKPKKRSILKKSKNKPKSNDAHMDSFILKRPHSPTHSPKRKQRQLIESNATVVNESLLHPYYESLEQFDFSHPQPNHQQNLKNVEERIIRNIYMNGSHEELFQLLEGDSEANFIKNIDIKIDSLGHSALQWAGCLSNIPKVKWLISYNASSTHLNISGESTLMLVIGSIFSYQARSFKELLDIFQDAMYSCDLQHRTLWHHIVLSFSSLDCLDGSIYYANTLRDWLMNSESVAYNTMFANIEDCNGNTALHLAQKLNSNFLTELIVSCGGRLDDNQEILNEYQIEESLSLRVDHC